MRALMVLAPFVTAAPLWAQDLPPAPGYFVDAVFETTMAQSLALSCPQLSFEIREASLYSGEVMARLNDEGFDTNSPDGVAVSGFNESLSERVEPFLARYGLDTDTSAQNACAAGLAELAADSPVARFLIEVSG